MNMRTHWRLLPLALTIVLAACATGAESERMTVAVATPTGAGFPAPLLRTMCVRTVTGGEPTNPLWASKVDNAEFQKALSASMQGVDLIAPPSGCKYPVDVNLLGLSQPTIGFSFEVTSHVNYKVYDASDQPLLLETISAPFTATMNDSMIGIVRLKRANEGSIRASITQFLEKLRAVKLP